MSPDTADTLTSAAAPADTTMADITGRPLVGATSGGEAFGSPTGLSGPMAVAAPTAGLFAHTADFLLDVQINLSVEVGRIPLTVREVLSLGPGHVIELQRSASEPVEVHANGRCIGRGEIVVVGEQFGVRITELGPP
jgi:flagellar motor switch protein FliN